MNVKTILNTTVTVVIAAVIFAAFLVPIVSGMQAQAGPTVNYANDRQLESYTTRLTESDDADVTLTFTKTDGWKYNGVSVESGLTVVTNAAVFRAVDWNSGVLSYAGGDVDARTGWGTYDVTVVYSNHTLTITIGNDEPITESYNWMLIPSENGEYVTVTGTSGNLYVNSVNDIICAGYYSTGDNDAYYWVKDGKAHAGAFDASATFDLKPVDGTTDVYTTLRPTVSIGEESFTPWFCLVKLNVTGHEASGAEYSLIGLIPLLFAVALVIGIVGSIALRRND